MKSTFILGLLLFFSYPESNVISNEEFIGKWSFVIENGFNCYACHKIEFGNNGTGNLIMSSSEKIEFTYKLLPENKIKFDFSNYQKQSLFKQSDIFYYEIETADGFKYIDLLYTNDKLIIHSLIASANK